MEKDEIMQMRGMFEYYRGTKNRPDSYGSDMYNDATDMAVSDPKSLIEIGRDDNDNPIMTSPTAQAQMGTGEEPEEKSMLAGALDVVAPIVKPVGGNMLEYLYRFGEATDEERKTMTIPYMAKTAAQKVIHNMDDATKIEHSDLYMNFFYNAEQKNAEANRIAKLLKIDADAFMHDQKLFQQAALAAERVERMGKFREYQDANGDIDMDKIYAAIPGLAEVQKQHGTQAAALALGNADGVKSITDVYSNSFTRFFGSLGTGIQRSMYTSFVGDIWSKLRQERRLPNAEEQEKLDKLEAKLKDLPAYSYDSAGEAVGAAMGSALENLWMIGGSQKFAVTASALAGLYSGNPVVAKRTYDLISTAVMADDIAAQQYKENVQKLDKYGRPMYTPEQAALLSEGQGVGEAILEQFSFKQMGRAIFGKSVGVEIQSIIKKSATNEAAKAGFKELALLKIKKAAEAGFITGSAETFEEFSQSVSDMVMENIAQVLIKGKDAELNSLEDIFYKSAAQAAAAIPAIAGFGIFGFLGHPVANTRAVLGFRSNVRRVVNDSMMQGAMANAHYREVLTGVWANKQNIKELQNKAPEVVGTLLDEHNKKAGLAYGFVDVKTLAQQKGGKELVEQIARANNISDDELAVCMDGSGMLQVKTSTLMQMDLQDEQKNAITDNLTTSLDAVTRAQHKEALQIASTQLKDLQAYEDKTYKQSVDNIIAARFLDTEQARLAREIIEANYENPQAEFKRRLDAVNAEINEIIDPVLRELRHGMKQGVTLVRDAEGNATGARVSNNDQWYSNYYADYGRAPSNEGLINLAMDIASGRQDPRYGLPDYQNNTDESREYFAGVAERMDKLEEERDALRAIKDRLQELRPSEMAATATLSKEGLEVYDAAIRWMGTSNNEKVQKAGRLNALLLARYADNMAKVFSRIKQKPYTAKDFIRERLKIDVNAVQGEKQNAAQMFQVSPAEFERQKEKVRKLYIDSDQWMKAPNGEPTNLTEDQWVTVRTPAFKNWFGDWEYIANAYPEKTAENRPDVADYIASLKGKILKSKEENVEASFSHKGLGKIASDAAINKSKRNGFSVQDHFTAVANIEKLFSNSIKANERKDHNNSIKGIEHFSSLFMDKNNEPALVTFTVKVTDNAGRKIYSIELMELKKVEGTVQGEARKLHQATSTFDTLNISRIAEKINNCSKIVDKNGEPLVVYHGSDADFDTFDRTKARANMDIQGNFFSPWKEDAAGYGENVRAFFLNIRKPANEGQGYKALNKYKGQNGAGIKAREDLTGQGFDGVNNENEEYIAFEPNQIKDATGRNEGFDPESGNIYLQMAGEHANNAPMEALQQAIEMEKNGADKYDIWKETGWMQGADGRWRFEIKDNLNDIDLSGLDNPSVGHTLSSIYNNSKLYDAYPWLADVIVVADLDREGASYDKGNGIIHLSKSIQKKSKTSLIHEIQHAIQEYEGFAGGGSPETVLLQIDREIQKVTKQMRDNHPDSFAYHRRKKHADYALLLSYSGKDAAEKRANEDVYKEAKEELETFEKYTSMTDEQKAAAIRLGNRLFTLERQLSKYAQNPYEAYFDLAGESEARTTASRAEYFTEEYDKLANSVSDEAAAKKQLDAEVNKLTPDQKETYNSYVKLLNETENLPDNYNEKIEKLEKDIPQTLLEAYGNYDTALWISDANSEFLDKPGHFPTIHGTSPVIIYNGEEMPVQAFFQYYQQPRLKGSITENDRGQRLISLFEGADQSTFMHEMAHMFLMDLQEIAGIDPNGREAKDLKTIMDWAQYRPGQSEEYKGTSSEAEFRSREEAIKAAVAAGNMQEAERLKNVWAQERFARGFEEYLRTGEAPARGLKYAFRQFKKWLMNIYRDVTGAGVRATPEVEAIMARMIASDEEIEALAAANNIARLKKLDPDILTDDVTAMRERWREEGKEKAKEKMLRQLVKQYEQQNLKDLDKKLEEVRLAKTLELQNVPCFVCEELLAQGNSLEIALDICEFGSDADSLEKREAMYKEALYAAGGSLKQAVEREVSLARAQMLEAMPSQEELYKMAEEALNSGVYNARLSELEAQILQAREKAYNEIPTKLQAAFTDLDGSLSDLKKESWEAVKKKIQKLKYAERWKAEEFAMLKEFEDAAAKLDPDDKEAVDRLLKEYQRIKDMVVRNKDWVRGVRDATKGQVEALRLKAQAQMDRQPISAATNPRHWQRQAFAEGKAAWDALSKSQGKGIKNGTIEYRNAISAKMQQALYDFMTALAIKNRKRLDQLLNGRDGMYARAKRMADPKFKADADMRYFHNHLMYVVGLRTTDAIAPATEKSFVQLLNELREAHEFEDEVPNWIIQLASADTRGKQIENYQQLTMGELEELDKVLKILYTLGRNKNRLLTLDVDMDTVRAEIMQDFNSTTDYEVGNQRINEVKGAIGEYMNGLLKEEQILSILGGKQGGFIKYIYKVMFKATEMEEKALEAEAKAQRELYNSFYTHEELRAMVNDTLMEEDPDGNKTKLQIGEDTDITKEHLICMALNWGNRTNRDRLLVGLFDCRNASDIELRGNELMAILQRHLTKKDWQFVQAMWDHIGTFADPVSAVMEKSIGVPLDRVKAEAFEVMLPDGEMLKMDGGYYPIVKDSGKSSRQQEFEQMEEAKSIGGASVFGTGISATKNRASNRFVNQQGPLKLSLDVAHKHIKAQIHYANMRMAVRDAYKVLNNENVKYAIEHSCGSKTVEYLNEWILNCWAPPIRPHEWLEHAAAKIRSKTVSAIMAYRASTALLNFANVVYMAQEIGVSNALSAMADFYKHPQYNRREILEVSVFMRNRATNMDRDLNAMQDKILSRHEGITGKVGNALDKVTGGKSEEISYLMDKYANWMIEQTDMMVSLPLYRWQFQQTYSEEIAKGVPEYEARETANYEATRRVTKVFGSSRAIDSSHVQRTKNEFVKLITPFFSFANTMMNAVYSKHYEAKLQGKNYGNEKVALRDSEGNVLTDEEGNVRYTTAKEKYKMQFCHRYARFARAAFMNFFLGALVETWLRQVPDWLAGGGDDDDEDKFLKELGKNVMSNAAAGFPGINEGINTIYSIVAEKRANTGRGVGVLSGSAERFFKLAMDVRRMTEGSDSIDAIDFFRDVARAANTQTGMSDTITDAVFNTVRFALDDGYIVDIDNPDDMREYIAKTLFDRKLKKRK